MIMKNKTVLILGCSSDIGIQTAKKFLEKRFLAYFCTSEDSSSLIAKFGYKYYRNKWKYDKEKFFEQYCSLEKAAINFCRLPTPIDQKFSHYKIFSKSLNNSTTWFLHEVYCSKKFTWA